MSTENPKPYPQLDMVAANKQCRPFDKRRAVSGQKCPVCHMSIILHCGECEIQVTGCLCTEERNHGPEIARERMLQKGIWLPEWGDKPSLLGADGKPTDMDRLHG